MAILWINFHVSTASTVRNEWLTSSDPISFQPSSSTFLNLDEQKKTHSLVGKWKLLFARRSQATSIESHMVFAMKRDNKTGRNKFSSMWRLWINSGLGRKTNSLRPFLIPAVFSNRLRPLAPTLLQIHRKKTLLVHLFQTWQFKTLKWWGQQVTFQIQRKHAEHTLLIKKKIDIFGVMLETSLRISLVWLAERTGVSALSV